MDLNIYKNKIVKDLLQSVICHVFYIDMHTFIIAKKKKIVQDNIQRSLIHCNMKVTYFETFFNKIFGFQNIYTCVFASIRDEVITMEFCSYDFGTIRMLMPRD